MDQAIAARLRCIPGLGRNSNSLSPRSGSFRAPLRRRGATLVQPACPVRGLPAPSAARAIPDRATRPKSGARTGPDRIGRAARRLLSFLALLIWAGAWPAAATAEPAEPAAPAAAEPAESAAPAAVEPAEPAAALPGVRVTNLDGLYLALGPTAALVRADGQWDGGFGGEISLVRVREREPLAALGLTAGALRLVDEDRGRAWSELLAGSRIAGVHVGLGAGASVELDELRPPRWGGHATLWIFAGVVPYARLGMVEGGGSFAEMGIRIAFPVFHRPAVPW
jgi:hypothetical protein